MAIKFRNSLRHRINQRYRSALDKIYAPVISRLTTEEYYCQCGSRNDCLRVYLARRTQPHREYLASRIKPLRDLIARLIAR